MDFTQLIQSVGLSAVCDAEGGVLSDLTDDSRRVGPGMLFVARSTGDDRWQGYVRSAVEAGAAAVVAPGQIDLPEGVGLAVAETVDQAMAGRLAAAFFGHPAERLKLIGITGTNGKTTVASLIQFLLQEAGMKCGLIGTVAIDDGGPAGPRPAELTTPGAIDLHRSFAAMTRHGCGACVMEVSSHALDQGRVDRLDFDAAVFTNLTQDHLDYHGTMDAYAEAKRRLFRSLDPERGAVAVLNADDPAWRRMAPDDRVMLHLTQLDGSPDTGAAVGEQTRLFAAQIRRLSADRSLVVLSWPMAEGPCEMEVELPLVGRHNVSNVLQAVAAVQAVKPMPAAVLVDALEDCRGVPGRLESVRVEGVDGPAVLVDYAHTPDALANVIGALRPLTAPPGRLIVVFGCGGDRDRTKRPVMASIASAQADLAILTSDNPRTEDPQQILSDALAGVAEEHRAKVTVQIDRAEAIRTAVRGGRAGDTVLIAGKGHEDYQILGTTKIHFDDREHAAEALRQWKPPA